MSNNHTILNIGLCSGRHTIPEVEEYIFDSFTSLPTTAELDETVRVFFEKIEEKCIERYEVTCFDYYYTEASCKIPWIEINLYVTGFTPMLLAVIKYCAWNGYKLTCFNYNRDTASYEKQEVLNYAMPGYNTAM